MSVVTFFMVKREFYLSGERETTYDHSSLHAWYICILAKKCSMYMYMLVWGWARALKLLNIICSFVMDH